MTIFVEIADQGSMSAAARSLGVVNSVVSKNLTELERWLGRKLVFRSTRNMRLTQDGVTYLDQCRKILQQVAWLEAKTSEQDKAVAGHLRLTAPAYLGHKLLPGAIATFTDAYPKVTVELMLGDDFKDMVDEGIDIALRISQMPDSGFISKRIGKVRLLTVAHPDYIAAKGAPAVPKDLKDHICLTEKSSSRKQLWRFASRNKAQSTVQVEGCISASTGEMVKALCAQGLGVAQLPDFLVSEDIESGNLVELLQDYALDNFYIHLLYHQKATGSLALRVAVDHLASSLKEQCAPS